MSPPASARYPVLLTPHLTAPQPGPYILQDPKRGRHVAIDAPALTLLAAFDGQRTCAEVAAALEGSALAMLYDEDFVCAFAEALAQRGLVQLLDAPGQRPSPLTQDAQLIGAEPLRHRCVGCGRSCEGHDIGPLDPDFLARLPDISAQLSLSTEHLLIEHRGDTFLAMTPAQACIFLGPDRRCRIHAQLGAAAKPLACRLFPIQIVETESGLRVGATRCFEAHRSWQPEHPAPQPVLAATVEAITGIPLTDTPAPDIRGLNPRAPLMLDGDLPRLSIEGRTRAAEGRVTAALARQDGSLTGFLAALLDEALTPGDALALPPHVEEALAAYARTLAALKKADLADAAPSHPESTRAVLLEVIDAVERFRPTQPRSLTARELAYGWHVARQWFHVRNWQHHPSMALSGALIAFGIALAAWRASQEDPAPEDGEVRERFAHTLVGWTRLIASRAIIAEMFRLPDPLA